MKDCYALTENYSDDVSINIFRGSINLSLLLKKQRPNWIGNWHFRDSFLCTHYYSFWGEYLTQKLYFMMTLGELFRNWNFIFDVLGLEDRVFIRPDSGEKEFTGQLIERDNKLSFQSDVIGVLHTHIDELCIVSKPVNIQKEIRLVIVNKKISTGSQF